MSANTIEGLNNSGVTEAVKVVNNSIPITGLDENGLPVTLANGTTPATNIVAEITSSPGSLETRTLTIGAAGDCFTSKAAPAIAELLTCDSFTAGKKRCRITMHVQPAGAATDIPHAAQVVATLNAPDDLTAVSRLTYVDVTAGGTASTDTRQRMLSVQNPVIEWDLTKTSSSVSRVDMGGYLPVGTSTLDVYLVVEAW